MLRTLKLLFDLIVRSYCSRSDLLLENLALRQQLAVLKRRHPQPRFAAHDKLFWVILRRLWPDWRRALILVQPETVVGWHRAGFKLYWTWLSRHRNRVGRRCVSRELRGLIFRMVSDNPTWGAPRIHGELKMLGFDISERSVLRWMRRAPRSFEPAKRWAAFLNNHREAIAAMDFFTMPTLTFGVLYCFFVFAHDRRRILHCNVTRHPTSAWVVQQLREAFPFDSGRQMLEAIRAGEDSPEQLAQLARGKLKSKIPQLVQAMEGRVRAHHRFLLTEFLEEWDWFEQRIVRLEAEIDKQIGPFEQALALWQTKPGIDHVTACCLVAEIGVNMNQFPMAQHLASWAAICPGNHESAGKRKSGKTRDGNKWLRRTLCQAAWAVSRKKNCYFSSQFKRIAARRGPKRALMAVAHSMLVIGYQMLKTGQGYRELGGNYLEQINKDQLQRHFVKRL